MIKFLKKPMTINTERVAISWINEKKSIYFLTAYYHRRILQIR